MAFSMQSIVQHPTIEKQNYNHFLFMTQKPVCPKTQRSTLMESFWMNFWTYHQHVAMGAESMAGITVVIFQTLIETGHFANKEINNPPGHHY